MKRAGGAVETSRLKGFYKLDVAKRVDEIARLAGLDDADRRALLEMEGFGLREADHMIENVIGILPLPIGVAANFKIDGIDRLVPMAIEEPSVVAAASNSARVTLGSCFILGAAGAISNSSCSICIAIHIGIVATMSAR